MPMAASRRFAGDQGVALIVVLLAIALLMALGLAVVLPSMTEDRIAGAFRDGVEALYAADAAAARALADLPGVDEWDRVLDGSSRSTFVDGPPGGPRVVPGGGTLDLTVETNMLRCGEALCDEADLTTVTAERPWGLNNPRWQLYAYGRLADLLPDGAIDSPMYVAVWVGDDPAESDDNPLADGLDTAGCVPGSPACRNPGRGIAVVRAHAYGPRGTRRVLRATVTGHGNGGRSRLLKATFDE